MNMFKKNIDKTKFKAKKDAQMQKFPLHAWRPLAWNVWRNGKNTQAEKRQCSQNKPIKPAAASLWGFVVRLYHKMCFCRGNGSGSRASGCQKITVYLNGLPLNGTVRMCNHKEISVPNKLAGLSKQQAWVALWFWNLHSWHERRQRQWLLFSVFFFGFFDDCCDLLRQHSTVIFANVF